MSDKIDILVTRKKPEGKNELDRTLKDRGFNPIYVETTTYKPVRHVEKRILSMTEKILEKKYAWLIITSSKTVDFLADNSFFDCLKHNSRKKFFNKNEVCARAYDVKIACVGKATFDALFSNGFVSNLVAKHPASAQNLVEKFPVFEKEVDTSISINNVLYPASRAANTTIETGLTIKKWQVDRQDLYFPQAIEGGNSTHPKFIGKDNTVTNVLVTAPSAIEGLKNLSESIFDNAKVYTLGKTTASALEKQGISCTVLDLV